MTTNIWKEAVGALKDMFVIFCKEDNVICPEDEVRTNFISEGTAGVSAFVSGLLAWYFLSTKEGKDGGNENRRDRDDRTDLDQTVMNKDGEGNADEEKNVENVSYIEETYEKKTKESSSSHQITYKPDNAIEQSEVQETSTGKLEDTSSKKDSIHKTETSEVETKVSNDVSKQSEVDTKASTKLEEKIITEDVKKSTDESRSKTDSNDMSKKSEVDTKNSTKIKETTSITYDKKTTDESKSKKDSNDISKKSEVDTKNSTKIKETTSIAYDKKTTDESKSKKDSNFMSKESEVDKKSSTKIKETTSTTKYVDKTSTKYDKKQAEDISSKKDPKDTTKETEVDTKVSIKHESKTSTKYDKKGREESSSKKDKNKKTEDTVKRKEEEKLPIHEKPVVQTVVHDKISEEHKIKEDIKKITSEKEKEKIVINQVYQSGERASSGENMETESYVKIPKKDLQGMTVQELLEKSKRSEEWCRNLYESRRPVKTEQKTRHTYSAHERPHTGRYQMQIPAELLDKYQPSPAVLEKIDKAAQEEAELAEKRLKLRIQHEIEKEQRELSKLHAEKKKTVDREIVERKSAELQRIPSWEKREKERLKKEREALEEQMRKEKKERERRELEEKCRLKKLEEEKKIEQDRLAKERLKKALDEVESKKKKELEAFDCTAKDSKDLIKKPGPLKVRVGADKDKRLIRKPVTTKVCPEVVREVIVKEVKKEKPSTGEVEIVTEKVIVDEYMTDTTGKRIEIKKTEEKETK